MLGNIKKRSEGFTIIEVLIVLAIAGLIMLIVFLAVPALQRNSRNTQRRNDVSALLGLMQETVNNNNGDFPNASCDGAGTCWVSNNNLGFYDEAANTVSYNYNAAVPGTAPTGPGTTAPERLDSVAIHTAVKCSGNNADISNATTRSAVALFWVEEGINGTPAQQCIEL